MKIYEVSMGRISSIAWCSKWNFISSLEDLVPIKTQQYNHPYGLYQS
tara:strand:- start:206 stop:346 length:141 start_codon:yes stop_codon:yes gene_type:complete